MSSFDTSSMGVTAPRRFKVKRYNKRMASRLARRAHVNEDAVAVAFTYNNLVTTLVFGTLVDIAQFVPTIGGLIELAIGVVSFYFHRTVLVTEEHVYVFRDWPFHIPGRQMAAYSRGAGVVTLGGSPRSVFSRFIRRGQLTFQDGFVVYHSILWIRRAQYIAQEANIPAGQ